MLGINVKYKIGERLQSAAKEKFGPVKTQALLVEDSGVSQSSLGRVWRGEALGSRYVSKLAMSCDVRAHWLQTGEGQRYLANDSLGVRNLTQDSSKAIGFVYFKDIELMGGARKLPIPNDDTERYFISEETIALLNVAPERCFIASVLGESMEDTLKNGDLVLVDMDDKNWRSDMPTIFAFNHNGKCRIRRASETLSGGMRISSDNPDKSKYPDENYTTEESEEIDILGRVRWHSGVFL